LEKTTRGRNALRNAILVENGVSRRADCHPGPRPARYGRGVSTSARVIASILGATNADPTGHERELMLRLLGIRSWIGLMAVLVAAAGFYGMQDRLTGWWAAGASWWSTAQEERDWRQSELVFLKQAYDRLEAQRRQQPGGGPASLRVEQETILGRMRETAAPIHSKLSPDILALVSDQPKPEPAKPEPLAAKPSKPEPSVVEPAKPEPTAAKPESPVTEPPKPEPAAAVAAIPVPPPAAEPAKPEPAAAAVAMPIRAAAAEPVEPRLGSARFPRLDTDLSGLSRDPELERTWERVSKLRARPPKPAETAAKPVENAPKPAAAEAGGTGAKP
jgi:hypothetical protein